MNPALHICGAQVWDGEAAHERDVFVADGHFIAKNLSGALQIDLEGHTLLPGLINAHDHLELNHYPRTKFREVYDNAHQWGVDVNQRLEGEPFKTLRSYPIWDRLFIGGLKNLLCGATTVTHHGPQYREMYRRDFPVRVLKEYGWAHSLHFNTDDEIVQSYQSTPRDWPWFIHLAEGTDDAAMGEYRRLKALGCVGPNTVVVHGVGLDLDEIKQDYDGGLCLGGIVICPSTNIFLLNALLNVSGLDIAPDALPIAVGSDSRLTADGDMWDEMHVFSNHTGINVNMRVLHSLQRGAAQLTKRVPTYADFYIMESCSVTSRRSELAAVFVDGCPQIGDPQVMAQFPHIQTVACTLDAVEKRMHVDLARQVHRCKLIEPGLEVDALPTGKRFFFF